MTRLISTNNTSGFAKIILEQDLAAGIYIFVYETASSTTPERDHLQDTWDMAKDACLEDYGVPLGSWTALNASN